MGSTTTMPPKQFNRVVNHIGCCVPDLDAVIEWYTKHLGFRQLGTKTLAFDRAKDPEAGIFAIYGDKLQKGRFGFLVGGNGVGLELFEFDDPKTEPVETPFQYHKSGFFHLALTDPDPLGTAERLCGVGARRINQSIVILEEGEVVYVQDPWGNVLELLTLSYEEQALRLAMDQNAYQ